MPTPALPFPLPFPLPAEDRALSPHTGWTRAHWEAAADGLLAAVRPYASPGQARIDLPGPRPSWSGPASDGLEGYARTFLLAAFRTAGARGADPAGLLERYAAGLAAGTDPASGEGWPEITDRGQPMVEAASIALALRLTRRWLWERLDQPVRLRAARWLAAALHREPVDNNWHLFPLTVAGFLAELATTDPGLPEAAGADPATCAAAVARGLAKLDGWYLGEGWYTDGRPRAVDHYNGWALHLYPVLHAHLSGDAALLARYGPRLAQHLDGYARTFGGDGAPLHQGRSLIYRHAAAAPLWLGALTGHTPLDPGTTRRLASGALRHFLDRGAVDAEGLLPLGWYGAHPPMVQHYSGPASPYWSSKGFLGLLLPADHPVWTATEQPAPAERADAVVPLAAPGWLVQSTAADGLVRVHNHGSDDQPATGEPLPDDPLYARCAHSTATGPSFTPELPDNHFALTLDGTPTARGRITPLGTGPGWAASVSTPAEGLRITSLTLAHGPDEVRAHLVGGATPGTPARQTGWAVTTPDLHSVLHPVHGYAALTHHHLPGGTAYGPAATLPVLDGTVTDGLFVCTARLGAAADGPPPSVTVTGYALHVRWPDGTSHRAELGDGAVAVTAPSGAVGAAGTASVPGAVGQP
ncbi:DUF2264 domain-containing protein [Kitasatospora sp. NPDC096147]|uniref:DUF2264 domain-containing protein n=1 Tax=Kitasatospora sp. NPDC096147 TaxID=3364093 RepID=UPI0037F972F6